MSVVIAPRGARADLERCLESVRRAAHQLEVGVADLSASVGLSGALNAAAARSTGELLVFVAAYAELSDPGWLDALPAQAKAPGVGAVAPLSLFPDGRVAGVGAGCAAGTVAGGARVAASEWWHGAAPVEPIMRGADGASDGYTARCRAPARSPRPLRAACWSRAMCSKTWTGSTSGTGAATTTSTSACGFGGSA